MSERKGLEKNISVRGIMAAAIVLLSVALMFVSFKYDDYLVTCLLGVAPILSLVYTIAKHHYEKNLSSTKTGLVLSVVGTRVVATCTLKSSHPKRLFINRAYLIVDSGEEKDGIFNFKHVLRHEYGELGCLVEKKISAGGINDYTELNPEGRGYVLELQHLSSATILYLDPNEEFSDDCTINLTPGVYRAMFVITFKNADCNCAMKHFVVNGTSAQAQPPHSVRPAVAIAQPGDIAK